jgi:hypothetical protein
MSVKTMAWLLTRLPGGETFIDTRPKMTLAAKRSGREADMYIYSGKFTSNKQLLGRWVSIGGTQPEKLEKWVKPTGRSAGRRRSNPSTRSDCSMAAASRARSSSRRWARSFSGPVT